MEKMDGRGSLRGDHRRSCAGGYDMEKWTGEFGSPLPVGAKDGYGSLSGICGADDGCTEIHGKRCTLGLVGFVPGVDSKISRTAVGNGCVLSEPDETDAGFRR
jgi:hypothetical protein